MYVSYYLNMGLNGKLKPTCSVLNCGNPSSKSKGLCHKHYKRLYRHGDPLAKLTDSEQGCKKHGCKGKHKSKGYCRYHHSTIYMPLYGRKCKIEGCDVGVTARDMCQKHYMQDRSHYFYRLQDAILGDDIKNADLKRAFEAVSKKKMP